MSEIEDLQQENSRLKEKVADLEFAMEEFVFGVEEGRIKSRRFYLMFCRLISHKNVMFSEPSRKIPQDNGL